MTTTAAAVTAAAAAYAWLSFTSRAAETHRYALRPAVAAMHAYTQNMFELGHWHIAAWLPAATTNVVTSSNYQRCKHTGCKYTAYNATCVLFHKCILLIKAGSQQDKIATVLSCTTLGSCCRVVNWNLSALSAWLTALAAGKLKHIDRSGKEYAHDNHPGLPAPFRCICVRAFSGSQLNQRDQVAHNHHNHCLCSQLLKFRTDLILGWK